MIPLLEYGIEKHFEYKRPLANYGGNSGDTTAGIVRKLSQMYVQTNQYDEAITLIRRLLDKRKFEVNHYILELLSLTYAKALFRKGERQAAIDALNTAIIEYRGGWEKQLQELLTMYETEIKKAEAHQPRI